MKKKNKDYDLKPVFLVRDKNVKAQYYSDGSGYLVIETRKDNQDVYVEESGTFNSHIQELKSKIRLMKKAISILEKTKKNSGVKFKKAWWC